MLIVLTTTPNSAEAEALTLFSRPASRYLPRNSRKSLRFEQRGGAVGAPVGNKIDRAKREKTENDKRENS